MLTPNELMDLALGEATKSSKKVRPNPKVGAAIELINGTIVKSFHPFVGGPHAERVVLEECLKRGLSTERARIAVTLEPCAHTGRTLPCVDALMSAKVGEVIIPFLDPNPEVSGRGVDQLKSAGIKVVTGILEKECFDLNREWLWAQKLNRPFVTLKMATSFNHVWKAELPWITSAKAREEAMNLRTRVDVLITSGKTVREDDPKLTARSPDGGTEDDQPQVIVLSKSENVPQKLKVHKHPRPLRVEYWENIEKHLEVLKTEEIFDVMVEAGPTLTKTFFDSGVVDEVWRYISNEKISGLKADFTLQLKADFICTQTLQIDPQNTKEVWLNKNRVQF